MELNLRDRYEFISRAPLGPTLILCTLLIQVKSAPTYSEEENLRDAIFIVELLKAKYASLAKTEARTQNYEATQKNVRAPSSKQFASSPAKQRPQLQFKLVDRNKGLWRRKIDYDAENYEQATNAVDESEETKTTDITTHESEIISDATSKSTTPNFSYTKRKTIAKKKTTPLDIETMQVLYHSNPNQETTTTTTSTAKSMNPNAVLAQVEAEMANEMEEIDTVGTSKSWILRTRNLYDSKRATKDKLKKYTATIKVHLGRSRRYEYPLPANNAFCFFSPENPLCRTFI